MEERIYTFKNAPAFDGAAYQEAKAYIIEEAGKYGLIAECLASFRNFLQADYEYGFALIREQINQQANSALLEWDI